MQTCVACATNSSCARCNTTNTAMCLSCKWGWFLNGTICSKCPSQCAACFSVTFCYMCNKGFIPQQSGSLLGNSASGSLNCTSCTFPCQSCLGNPTTCTSCTANYTLMSGVCITNFNYQVNIVLNTILSTFQNNYLSFLNAIATAAGVTVQNIVVQSIMNGSVNVTMQVSSDAVAGSNSAITSQNNLNTILTSGTTIANMGITSSSITTNGGTNDNGSSGSSGLSTTTIIILATVIPIGTLLIVAAIVIIYCVHKRKKEQEAGMKEWNSAAGGDTTGRNIELSTNEPKRAYL